MSTKIAKDKKKRDIKLATGSKKLSVMKSRNKVTASNKTA